MSKLSSIFLKGLITLFPILLTVYLLAWIASRLDSIFTDPLRNVLPSFMTFPGIGLLLVLLLIFVVGLLVNSLFTQPFFRWLETQIQRLPVVSSIYNPLKDVTQLFANSHSGTGPQRVVMVQLPGMGGIEAIGLVTRDQFTDLPKEAIREDSLAVFVPFSYGIGGFTLIVPKSQVRETGIPAERALQLAITGWIKNK